MYLGVNLLEDVEGKDAKVYVAPTLRLKLLSLRCAAEDYMVLSVSFLLAVELGASVNSQLPSATHPVIMRRGLRFTLWARATGRPTWKARNREQAEAFFLESLSEWRTAMGIDKMVLVCILPNYFADFLLTFTLSFCTVVAMYLLHIVGRV